MLNTNKSLPLIHINKEQTKKLDQSWTSLQLTNNSLYNQIN